MSEEGRECLPVERRDLSALARGEPVQEMAREPGDVFPPLTQRRQLDGDDAQAVVQVLSELAPGDLFRQARVGRGEHADVDRDPLPAPDALDLPLLEHAQELGLERERHVPDLV